MKRKEFGGKDGKTLKKVMSGIASLRGLDERRKAKNDKAGTTVAEIFADDASTKAAMTTLENRCVEAYATAK